jgi:D-alanyl-D-alanine carboxypeptidase
VLVLQEVERGQLALDGTIGAYLPDYAGEARDRVTLRQLLDDHTSGIANFDQVTSMEDAIANGLPPYQSPFTTDQLLQKFCSGALVQAPGTTFDYNNGDYVILGRILERVTGLAFGDLLRERILAPLDMRDTGMMRQDDVIAGLADTYFLRDDGRIVNDLPVYPENWFAAGAMYSTTGDLARFSDALFGGRLLAPASMESLLAAGLDDYALGAWVYETKIDGRPHRVLKRPGSIMGAQAQFYRLLDDDITIIILGNVANTDFDLFVAEIGKHAARDLTAPRAR